jgi:hypothetical protein
MRETPPKVPVASTSFGKGNEYYSLVIFGDFYYTIGNALS